MESIDSTIQKINAPPDNYILVDKRIPSATYIDLMKKDGDVYYEEHCLYNLKGIRLQKDSNTKPFCPESVGPGGYPLEQSDLDGNEYCSTKIVVGDEETIIKYLKETNNWDQGMVLGKKNRWDNLKGAVDLCFPPV